MKRFNMYVYLLQSRLQVFPHSEPEPSLVETVIGEVDEPPLSSNSASTNQPLGAYSQESCSDADHEETTRLSDAITHRHNSANHDLAEVTRRPISERHSRHVQRSLSDRYSYRAAIYKSDAESDIL